MVSASCSCGITGMLSELYCHAQATVCDIAISRFCSISRVHIAQTHLQTNAVSPDPVPIVSKASFMMLCLLINLVSAKALTSHHSWPFERRTLKRIWLLPAQCRVR